MSRFYALDAKMHTTRFVQAELPAGCVRGRVLDAGCGDMPYKRLISRFCDEWVGLDIRPVGDVVGQMEEMPFDDESFDFILCTDALQYSPAPQLAFAEFARVLKHGGTLLVSAPNNCDDDDECLYRFPVAGLVDLAQRHGLTVEQAASAGSKHEALFEGYLTSDVFGHTSSGQLTSFVHDLDRKFPTISLLLAKKE